MKLLKSASNLEKFVFDFDRIFREENYFIQNVGIYTWLEARNDMIFCLKNRNLISLKIRSNKVEDGKRMKI